MRAPATQSSRRVLMYSHDTFGLGHLTRTIRIARAIQDRYENVSILVLSGLPVAPYLPLPPRTDLVKLPSVLKFGPEQYRARDLDVDFKQIRAMRRSVIRSTAETFRPHVFCVDNVPLGMKGEVLPTLDLLRGKAKCILNLRDVLDTPALIRERWAEEGVPAVLDRYYEAIHVFGDDRIFDAAAAYGLAAEKTSLLGYVTPQDRVPAQRLPKANGAPRPRTVLLTAGGGGDGLPLLDAALQGLLRLQRREGFELDVQVVTGPLMEDEDRRSLLQSAAQAHATVLEFVPDLPARMQRADLIIGMAGYNTCAEILACGAAALLHPRTQPRLEQKIRADAFAELGLARVLSGAQPSPDAVAEAVREIFHDGYRLDESALPRLSGQHRAAEALAPWIGSPQEKEGGPEGGARARLRGNRAGNAGGLIGSPGETSSNAAAWRPVGFRCSWVPPWPGAVAAGS